MLEKKDYSFSAILETVKLRHLTTAVFLPHHIIIELPKGRQRVTGHLNGEPFSLTIQFKADGSRFIAVGAALRKAARIETGSNVQVSFRILNVKDVELPFHFDYVTHQEDEMRRINRAHRNGKGKSLAEFVFTLMNVDSRIRKAVKIVKRSRSVPQTPLPNRRNKNK